MTTLRLLTSSFWVLSKSIWSVVAAIYWNLCLILKIIDSISMASCLYALHPRWPVRPHFRSPVCPQLHVFWEPRSSTVVLRRSGRVLWWLWSLEGVIGVYCINFTFSINPVGHAPMSRHSNTSFHTHLDYRSFWFDVPLSGTSILVSLLIFMHHDVSRGTPQMRLCWISPPYWAVSPHRSAGPSPIGPIGLNTETFQSKKKC